MNFRQSYALILFICGWLVTGCQQPETRQLLIVAGKKSHAARHHEYLKQARLLKMMLEKSPNNPEISVSIYLDEWPEPAALQDAHVIMFISDGIDAGFGQEVPFMASAERMTQMQQLMEQGVGFITYHFSTFANDSLGQFVLDWGGGYFDWQNEQGEREWYSAIKWLNGSLQFPNPDHPVCRGVQPFSLVDEFYYNIRFNPDTSRFSPLVEVEGLGSERSYGNVVAWSLERPDGGKGFGTTMGHVYGNWKHAGFRKFMLNAICWSAGATVPIEGIESDFYPYEEVMRYLYGKQYQVLLLTGNRDTSEVAWDRYRQSTARLMEKMDVRVDLSYDLTDLFYYDLRDYDALLFDLPDTEVLANGGRAAAIEKALMQYTNDRGGLVFTGNSPAAFINLSADSSQVLARYVPEEAWKAAGNQASRQVGSDQYRSVSIEKSFMEIVQDSVLLNDLESALYWAGSQHDRWAGL